MQATEKRASDSMLDVDAGLSRIAWIADGLRPRAVEALEEAERSRDGVAITRASLALGQIDTIRATLPKEPGAPPPQRRPRREREHTPWNMPRERVIVKKCR